MLRGKVKLTAIVTSDAVEARLELVAALAVGADIVVEALDVGGEITGSSRGSEGHEERVADKHDECVGEVKPKKDW